MNRTITRAQYVKACIAFWEALGGSANEAYFPVQLGESEITFPRAPTGPSGSHVRAAAVGYDAAPNEVLSIVTTITVVD
jgi:hypothetical protein